MKTIESIISGTINNDPIEIEIEGVKIKFAKPTLATLIEASALASLLPDMSVKEDGEVVQWIFSNAKNTKVIGDIAATFILGKKGLKKTIFGDKRAKLSKYLIENFSSESLFKIINQAVSMQEVGFFLTIITTLSGSNVLKKTKTTQYGE